jgi:hypothetical protein
LFDVYSCRSTLTGWTPPKLFPFPQKIRVPLLRIFPRTWVGCDNPTARRPTRIF